MPMVYACARGETCPYNGWTTKPLEKCDKCKEDERRENERYMRLMQKDSRTKRNKKGWRK